MKYLLLIYQDEKNWMALDKAARDKVHEEFVEFTEDIQKSGHYITGDALKPAESATTMRVREGKDLKTDGPFAETREQLGGFYMIEAKDLDEACRIAARIPAARFGSIEVREVRTFASPPVPWGTSS